MGPPWGGLEADPVTGEPAPGQRGRYRPAISVLAADVRATANSAQRPS